MKRIPTPILTFVLLGLLATNPVAAAGLDDFDIGTRFRAKIVKERAKQASSQSANEQKNDSGNGEDSSSCGSQNIGNINTGGRPGQQPREVFVFAPNSINVVSGTACR